MASGFSRVTVVAPRSRVDLALPADVPLADLLPTVLSYAGDALADDPAARNGWTLSRMGGAALDSSRSPAQLEVRDGELLYLRPRGEEAPLPVFDDVVDAVATAARERTGRWSPAATRVLGLTLGAVALLGGAVAVLLAGPPQLPGGLAGLGLAAALLLGAVVLARAVGDAQSATVFALVALAYAAAGGLLVLAGDRTVGQLAPPHVLVAATAVVLVAAAAAIGVGDAGPVFLCGGVCAVALLVAAAIRVLFEVGTPAAAAVTVTLVFATLPLLPMFAYRLGRLPDPSVPTDPEHLRQDEHSVDGLQTFVRSDRADAYLAGMLSALAVIGAVAAVAVSSDGVGGLALGVVLGLTMMARARWFLSRAQRLPLLGAGAVALAAAVVAAYDDLGLAWRLTLLLGSLLLVAAISVGFALAGGRRPSSPVWGRTLDIIEVVLILAIFPLAVWVSGLLGWIRAIRG
ncbi:type VII secretion integral membrane protein EccD [Plantactinospora sp. KLBMP9567]|uniref:type VII secretion integral membrane protein EccD n=1 Tax=Plantactinospora sp. KLBMP9567 TaxID=3085900 RepID=UPI002981779B|nr:type VII secretion integral membrane protein EccD [Plantactinospora sp. KLBMP9567]MDW5327953.1 type VII secretion integral membrane protein EccD [Plantactinospora sp. KLBMP9567]